MRYYITQGEIINYALKQIQVNFQTTKTLEVKYDLLQLGTLHFGKNLVTSFIGVNPKSVLYFDPEDRYCHYWGIYPPYDSESVAHFKAIKSFKSAINRQIVRLFEDVFDQKKTKTLAYAEQLDKQLFASKFV